MFKKYNSSAGVACVFVLLFGFPESTLAKPRITGLEWRSEASGAGLVATLSLSEMCSPERVRIMLDLDGQANGEARIGGDYMVEGPHLYQHAGGGDWSWRQIGAAPSVVDADRISVRISPLPPGGSVRAVAEITGEDWSTQSRFPEQGVSMFTWADLPGVNWANLAGGGSEPSLNIQSVEPFRTTAGGLGFRVAMAGNPDVSRIRIMIDTNKTASGWSVHGIDLMSEGALTFRYPAGEKEWRWDGIGEVVSVVQTNTIILVLPDFRIAGTFDWYAESFNSNWEVKNRYPAEGVVTEEFAELAKAPPLLEPPPVDLADLLKYMPVTLSRRIQKEYLDRPWKRSAAVAPFPRLPVPGLAGEAELFAEFTDAKTGARMNLSPDTAEQVDGLTRWSGRIDADTTWFLIAGPVEKQALDIIGGVESAAERCFRFTVGLTYPESTWTWHDDMSHSAVMNRDRHYVHDYASPYGLMQRRSYYPFAVISSGDAVLIAETDGREPRQFQIEARASENKLAVHYDMATTPLTGHFPGLATIHATLRAEPRKDADPFRSALQSWYDRDPDWYSARSPKHGLWLPFTDINTIAGADDFHFAFFEKVGALGRDVETAHASGVLNFPYTEPWLYWLPINDPAKWNRGAAVDRMRELSTTGLGKDRDFASAGYLGASRDAEQNRRITFLNTPWSNGGRMEVNTDPELPVRDEFSVNRAMAEWRYIQGVLADPRVDGIYLDSMSAMETIDYNPEAMKVADYPATFVLADLKPGLAMPVQAVEFTAALGRYLKAQGKYMMGNFPCWKFPFFMPYIDVPGEETTWYSGNQFTPLSARELNYRRAISGAKPFGFLQATHFDKLSRSDMEKYFRECLFYAFMPSFFSHDGANDPYWVDAAMYERDRPLFRQYLPLTIRLSEAGWRPVPAARTDHSAIRIEQYGSAGDDVYFITARNLSSLDVNSSIDLSDEAGPRYVYDMFSGGIHDVKTQSRKVERSMSPMEITCLVVIRPSALSDAAAMLRKWASNHVIYEAGFRNLDSLQREISEGVPGEVRQDAAVVGDEPARLKVYMNNNTSRPVTILEVAGKTGRMELVPGSQKVIELKSGLQPRADGWIHVSWSVDKLGEVVNLERLLYPRAIEPFTVTAPETRIQNDTDTASLEYSVISHRAAASRVTMKWTVDGVEAGEQSLEVSSEKSDVFRLAIPRDGRDVRQVDVALTSGGQVIHESGTHIVFVPRLNHKGMGTDVRVTADSAYSGYTTAVLNDGVVETAGLNWNEGAFATTETTDAHWIRVAFKKPETVSSVTVYWNREGGVTYASRCGEVWVTTEDGKVSLVGELTNTDVVARSTVEFPPVEASMVEWRQPPSCGSTERPGLLWLSELEIQ